MYAVVKRNSPIRKRWHCYSLREEWQKMRLYLDIWTLFYRCLTRVHLDFKLILMAGWRTDLRDAKMAGGKSGSYSNRLKDAANWCIRVALSGWMWDLFKKHSWQILVVDVQKKGLSIWPQFSHLQKKNSSKLSLLLFLWGTKSINILKTLEEYLIYNKFLTDIHCDPDYTGLGYLDFKVVYRPCKTVVRIKWNVNE